MITNSPMIVNTRALGVRRGRLLAVERASEPFRKIVLYIITCLFYIQLT